MNIICCLLSYEITKGMKSWGPIGLLKKNNHSEELVLKQINSLYKLFDKISLYVITGFGADKIQKKIPKHIKTIVNPKFHEANQAYAIKLFLESIEESKDEYDGIFIINSDILLKNLQLLNLNASWIVTKNKINQNKEDYLLGVGVDSHNKLHTIFYDIGEQVWCNAVYICKEDVLKIKQNIDMYYDNMFLFELINKSIDQHDVRFTANPLSKNSDCIIIKGMRDKYKIL